MSTTLRPGQMQAAIDQMLDSTNWTGLSLRELAKAGRVVPDSAAAWVTQKRVDAGKPVATAFHSVLVKHIRAEVARLNSL